MRLGERIPFRKCPCGMYMYKNNAVGSAVAETGRDCGTMSWRSFIFISALCIAVEMLSSKLTPRPSAVADSEKRQIFTVCALVRGQR